MLSWTEVWPDRIAYADGLLTPAESTELLEALRALPTWSQERMPVRGVEGGVLPNGVLLNRYRDGRDAIGRHTDREDDLVPGSPIVGVSLGATRTMRIRPAGGRAADEVRLPLRDGSVLLMHGDCQRALTHEVRREPDVAGERISLTFRAVMT